MGKDVSKCDHLSYRDNAVRLSISIEFAENSLQITNVSIHLFQIASKKGCHVLHRLTIHEDVLVYAIVCQKQFTPTLLQEC